MEKSLHQDFIMWYGDFYIGMHVVWLDRVKGAYQELSSITKTFSHYLARPRAFQYEIIRITQ